ncbi:histidine phosphatase family protein [Solihabitans fulvus]|uniref:Histidine phosphatase family protein n=1 Tax=Solihabitans fulvus TaxID=1892852 RepID=A0A5B2X1L9_9PSEU|nr:histidine phosphatase family protein [Solihabitans fulvus]KAA2257104.1 histidine phosphatase family protein [Solihabitans fulvus]
MRPLRLVLARHGETASNLKMALDSLPPGPPLTTLGAKQADELADALATAPVVAVYASTALRAQQTAAPVAARHGLDVEIVDGVQEVFVGDLEGRDDRKALERFFRIYSAWAGGELDAPMPGGETGQEVLDRYLGVISDVTAQHEEGTIVVVSHGAAVRLAALALCTNVAPTLAESGVLPNTGRVVLEADPTASTGWTCLEWTGLKVTRRRSA